METKHVADVELLLAVAQELTREQSQEVRRYADLVRNVQIGLSVWSPTARGDARGFTLVAFNPAAEKITGFGLEPSIGKSLVEIMPLAAGGTLDGILPRVSRDGCVLEATVESTKNPANPSRALSITASRR